MSSTGSGHHGHGRRRGRKASRRRHFGAPSHRTLGSIPSGQTTRVVLHAPKGAAAARRPPSTGVLVARYRLRGLVGAALRSYGPVTMASVASAWINTWSTNSTEWSSSSRSSGLNLGKPRTAPMTQYLVDLLGLHHITRRPPCRACQNPRERQPVATSPRRRARCDSTSS